MYTGVLSLVELFTSQGMEKEMKSNNLFIKFYRDRLEMIDPIQKGSNLLLNRIISLMDEDNTIMIHAPQKKRFANSIKTTTANISNGIAKLIQHDLLVRISTGYFMVNPYYCSFCQGSNIEALRDRYTNLKLRPELSIAAKKKIKEKDVPY